MSNYNAVYNYSTLVKVCQAIFLKIMNIFYFFQKASFFSKKSEFFLPSSHSKKIFKNFSKKLLHLKNICGIICKCMIDAERTLSYAPSKSISQRF